MFGNDDNEKNIKEYSELLKNIRSTSTETQVDEVVDPNMTVTIETQKELDAEVAEGKKGGLWDNIHAKRKRIKAGSSEKMKKAGEKGRPTAQDFKDASESVNESVGDDYGMQVVGEMAEGASTSRHQGNFHAQEIRSGHLHDKKPSVVGRDNVDLNNSQAVIKNLSDAAENRHERMVVHHNGAAMNMAVAGNSEAAHAHMVAASDHTKASVHHSILRNMPENSSAGTAANKEHNSAHAMQIEHAHNLSVGAFNKTHQANDMQSEHAFYKAQRAHMR